MYNSPGGGRSTPRTDINAPDLYLPTMAFVTYVLLTGYFMGTKDQ